MDWKEYAAGAVGGVAGLVVGHPLDTVKVLAQNSLTKPSYRLLFLEVQKRGNASFFRGLSVPLWSYGVVNSVFFGTYQNCYKFLEMHFDSGNNSDTSRTSYERRWFMASIAASLGATTSLILYVPVEVIKTKLQKDASEKRTEYRGPVDCLRKMWRQTKTNSGMTQRLTRFTMGIYRGFWVQMARDVISAIAYFISYSELFHYLHRERSISMTNSSFSAGAFAGMLSWSITLPLDVLKTRLQAHSTSAMLGSGSCSGSYPEHDLRTECRRMFVGRSMFRGYGLTMVRAFFVNGLTFVVYEICVEMLK